MLRLSVAVALVEGVAWKLQGMPRCATAEKKIVIYETREPGTWNWEYVVAVWLCRWACCVNADCQGEITTCRNVFAHVRSEGHMKMRERCVESIRMCCQVVACFLDSFWAA